MEKKPDDDWLKKHQQLMVDGKAGRGRGGKTWLECGRRYIKELGLRVGDNKERDDAKDRQV